MQECLLPRPTSQSPLREGMAEVGKGHPGSLGRFWEEGVPGQPGKGVCLQAPRGPIRLQDKVHPEKNL